VVEAINKIVIIPVYKSEPDRSEKSSFSQCLKILYKHKLCLVTYCGLDISYYTDLLGKDHISYRVEFFEEKYFENLSAYNRLMLSVEFYGRFGEFEYMLVYQLDAWVFSDELDFWCKEGYDYIGAPWFDDFGTHENGNNLWAVGNGGFSLRRVTSFLEILHFKKPLFTIKTLKLIHPEKPRLIIKIRRILIICLKSLGIKNNINYYIKKFRNSEDYFWTVFLQRSESPLTIPKCTEGLKFSFERSPAYLYKLNGYKLPFGCHAWRKNDYELFWKNYIQEIK
jgi:hypothetical protein